MTKLEFLTALREKLSGLPDTDINERLEFYSEAIDDRIEDGMSEEDATASIGNVDEIAAQIISDTPFTKLVKEKISKRRSLSAFEIVLLALGAPIWLSILVSLFSIILSVYLSVWVVVISFWAVFVSFVGSAFGFIIGGIGFSIFSNVLSGVALISAGLVLAGLSILTFFVCKVITKGTARLTKKFVLWIKNLMVKKEAA